VTRGDNYSEVSPIGVPSSLKYINEQILREVCNDYDLKLTIARIFNTFGGNDEFSVISKIYNCFINKTKLSVLNDGKSVRDYIHINNIVDIYEKILLDSSIKLDTIDVGSGLGKSLAEILIYLSNNGFTFNTENTNKNEIDFSQANTSMIKKIIDISTFIDVNVYLLDKLKSSGDKNQIIR
jgi:UDP-glucose 4-epimerase